MLCLRNSQLLQILMWRQSGLLMEQPPQMGRTQSEAVAQLPQGKVRIAELLLHYGYDAGDALISGGGAVKGAEQSINPASAHQHVILFPKPQYFPEAMSGIGITREHCGKTKGTKLVFLGGFKINDNKAVGFAHALTGIYNVLRENQHIAAFGCQGLCFKIISDSPFQEIDQGIGIPGKRLGPGPTGRGHVVYCENLGDLYVAGLANYAKDNNLLDDESVGLIYVTMSTVSSCVPRTEGAEAAWADVLGEGVMADRTFYADFETTLETAYNAVSAVVTGNPQIKTWLVTTPSENGALGAGSALEEAGLDKTSCVVALGADEVANQWDEGNYNVIREAAYFSGMVVGRTCGLALGDFLLNGTELPAEYATPAIMIDQTNYLEHVIRKPE